MKINITFLKVANCALAGLISILSFSGCKKSGLEEYGVPKADYTFKGSVVNKADEKPIEGIRVGYITAFQPIIPTPSNLKASVATDAKGEFVITKNIYPIFSYQTITVYVEDIDGEEYGLFQSDTLDVDFSDAQQTKRSDKWYDGEFTVIKNVELNKIN